MVVIVQARMQKSKEDSKEGQIKRALKTLDIYPIKNLEDLYDKEGYREMANLKKVIRGRGRYIQILPKVIKAVNG